MFCITTLSFRTTSFFHQIKNFGMEIRYIYKHKCIFIYLFLTEIFTDDHNQAHTSYININKMILNYDGFWERHLLTWPVIPIQPMRALSIFWKTICEKISDYWPQKSQNCLLTWLKKKKSDRNDSPHSTKEKGVSLDPWRQGNLFFQPRLIQILVFSGNIAAGYI